MSPSKAGKSNTSAKSLLEVTIKNTTEKYTNRTKSSFYGYVVVIYIHKKAGSNFKLSGKPMNGNAIRE